MVLVPSTQHAFNSEKDDESAVKLSETGSNLDVESHVEVGRRMGDPAGGGVVDTGRCHRLDAFKRDATRGLEREAAANNGDGLTYVVYVHVAETHRVGKAHGEHLAELVKAVHLDLDLDQMAGTRTRALKHGPDAARDCNVIVFDQHRVVETEAVVEAAAAAHGVFLE